MCPGDVEEGMGNSHGPPNSTGHGMHNATTVPGVTSDEKPGSPPPEEEMQQNSGSGDKSVLQAKLTNLAIQIGYGGIITNLIINFSVTYMYLVVSIL